MTELLDITPSPRILRTLGEIPFEPWQCIAELLDNAFDEFKRAERKGIALPQKKVVVSWSSATVAEADRQLEVVDTGLGMDIEAIRKSVQAGYTTNNRVDALGLFGMGFNIATARLGDETIIMSATKDSPEWVGIKIDFAELGKLNAFRAPQIHLAKSNPNDHGTRIIIKRLKPAIFNILTRAAIEIRSTLADVYAPLLLQDPSIQVIIQSKILTARQHCVWGPNRYVIKGKETIPARIEIDEDAGQGFFDVEGNRYLSVEEEESTREYYQENGTLPLGIIERTKKIRGWLGIQRYSDPDDWGIDFIRNGRKILLRNKSLFSYTNPLTGRSEIEYPLELGTTVGGRIVGEIYIDHVPPTYQKNDFNRTDPSWYQVVETLRGTTPIRPAKRKVLGYKTPSDTPLARLILGYEVNREGTRHLAASNRNARQFAVKFRDGTAAYQTDDLWWEDALQIDRANADKDAKNSPPVDSGSRSSDSVSEYLPKPIPSQTPPTPTNNTNSSQPILSNTSPSQTPQPTATPQQLRSDYIAALKARSRRVTADYGDYTYPGCSAPFKVTVWELSTGKIGDSEEGDPCLLEKMNNLCDFFFDPRHPFLRDYPTTYKDLLLVALAERFKTRDNLADLPLLFSRLITQNFPALRLDRSRIQETAESLFNQLREKAVELLAVREQEAIDLVYNSAGEVEEIVSNLIQQNRELLKKFQSREMGAIDALIVAPPRTLVRLVDTFPDEFFDEKFFRTPYLNIELADINMTMRLRNEAKDRLLSFLKDALWVLGERQASSRKAELSRCAQSLSLLEQEMVE